MLLNQVGLIFNSAFNPDCILGVCRGGWIPARILSDLLENKFLAHIKLESYVGIGTVGRLRLTQDVSVDVRGKKVLIVDDVCDSGGTLNTVKKYVLEKGAVEAKTASLYCKCCSEFKPDYFIKKTSCWVIFPWELKELLREIFENNKHSAQNLNLEIDRLLKAGYPEFLLKTFQSNFYEVKKC